MSGRTSEEIDKERERERQRQRGGGWGLEELDNNQTYQTLKGNMEGRE